MHRLAHGQKSPRNGRLLQRMITYDGHAAIRISKEILFIYYPLFCIIPQHIDDSKLTICHTLHA